MRAKARLRDWAIWRLEGGFVPPTGSTPLGRIQDDERNAGASAGGFRYDIFEFGGHSYACMPDGGMFDTYCRFRGSIERDAECRETQALVNELGWRRRDLWETLELTYSGPHPRDLTKQPHAVAKTLRIKPEEYRARMGAIYDWLERRLGMRAAA